jgi:hypothetical protein
LDLTTYRQDFEQTGSEGMKTFRRVAWIAYLPAAAFSIAACLYLWIFFLLILILILPGTLLGLFALRSSAENLTYAEERGNGKVSSRLFYVGITAPEVFCPRESPGVCGILGGVGFIGNLAACLMMGILSSFGDFPPDYQPSALTIAAQWGGIVGAAVCAIAGLILIFYGIAYLEWRSKYINSGLGNKNIL